MWEGVCGSSGAGERETLGRDLHKWIKRALILYKHIEMAHGLCTNTQNDVKYKRHECTWSTAHTRVDSCGNTLCCQGVVKDQARLHCVLI